MGKPTNFGEGVVSVMYVSFLQNRHSEFRLFRGKDSRGISLKHVYTPEQLINTLTNDRGMGWDVVFFPGYFPYGKDKEMDEALALLATVRITLLVFTGAEYSEKKEKARLKEVAAKANALFAHVPYDHLNHKHTLIKG